MGDVARYQRKAMDYGGGGEEAVNDGHVASGVHSAPSVSNGGIHGQDAVGENIEYPVQPSAQVSSLCLISATRDQHNALANFADGQCTNKQIGNNSTGEPGGDTRIATPTAALF